MWLLASGLEICKCCPGPQVWPKKSATKLQAYLTYKANTENTSRYVAACIALHNFLLKESQVSSTSYCPPGTGDTDDWEGKERAGSWWAEPNSTAALTSQSNTRGRPTSLAYAMRDKLSHYFITAGKVPWQDDMV
ncbi:protein ALP1-like [Ixodes scapularis]